MGKQAVVSVGAGGDKFSTAVLLQASGVAFI